MPVVDGKSSISGYSGAAVKPIALRFCAQLLKDPTLKDIPISGIGGIETWRDAVEFLMIGCRNVQVTTAIMQYGYRIVEDMISGVSHFMDERGYNSLDDFIGIVLPNLVPAEEIRRTFKVLPSVDFNKCIGCGRCYISCFDGAHQAFEWDEKKRRPILDEEKCVGCHLCLNVCPVQECITPGEVVWLDDKLKKFKDKKNNVIVKHHYE
jgi:dihydropyrimidine dehydrogenase (NAD+) subunit PreA